jgi:rubrerythrin
MHLCFSSWITIVLILFSGTVFFASLFYENRQDFWYKNEREGMGFYCNACGTIFILKPQKKHNSCPNCGQGARPLRV